jgi:hypothetical protein
MDKPHTELFDFRWQRAKRGYAIAKQDFIRPEIDTILAEKHSPAPDAIIPISEEFEDYPVFYKTDMSVARRFAGLINSTGELDWNRAIKFANDYGLLGLNKVSDSEEYRGEGVNQWIPLTKEFKRIFDLYDKKGAHNKNLERAISLYNGNAHYLRLLSMIRMDSKQTHRLIYFRPANLITAMWLILAEELTAGVALKKCQNQGCLKWFPDRSNKKYCGDSCRVSGNRKKKHQARV